MMIGSPTAGNCSRTRIFAAAFRPWKVAGAKFQFLADAVISFVNSSLGDFTTSMSRTEPSDPTMRFIPTTPSGGDPADLLENFIAGGFSQ
jgi:hypothetical protein